MGDGTRKAAASTTHRTMDIRHKILMSGGGCERLISQIFASAGMAIAEPMMIKQMPTIHAMVGENLGVSLIPDCPSPEPVPAAPCV